MAPITRRTNYVCFHCRLCFKHIYTAASVVCPGCGGNARHMGPAFKAPPRHLANQWRKVELLASAGAVFHHNYPFPTRMKPIKTLADGKAVAQAMRQELDTTLTRPVWVQPRRRSPRLLTALRLGQTQQLLRQARASRASKAKQGNTTRTASLDREIARLERRITRLKQVLR